MKTVISALTMILACVGITVCSVWALVEFILYLVKDRPFNWWSLWCILICVAVSIAMFIVTQFVADLDRAKKNDPTPGKSAFQKRLEQMKEQQERLKKQ